MYYSHQALEKKIERRKFLACVTEPSIDDDNASLMMVKMKLLMLMVMVVILMMMIPNSKVA